MKINASPQNAGTGGETGHPNALELRGWSFRLPLPKGWVDRTIYCAAGPVGTGVQATVTLSQESVPKLDLEQFVAEQLQQLSGQLEEFSLIKREKRALRGTPCVTTQFSWQNAAGAAVQQAQWYLLGARCVFMITVTAPKAEFAELAAELEGIVSGFVPSST